jgi:hypothetical protein
VLVRLGLRIIASEDKYSGCGGNSGKHLGITLGRELQPVGQHRVILAAWLMLLRLERVTGERIIS